jgi:tetratricopeptide (TPR) repeat protein
MAEREYRRAIDLDPNYATAHHWDGEFLGLQGRFQEAFTEIERAGELDPLALIIAADKGVLFYYARDYDRSIAQLRAVLDMEPTFQRAYMIVGPFAQKGMYREALAQLAQMKAVAGEPWTLAGQAYIYGVSGDREHAQKALAELQRLGRQRWIDPTALAFANLGLGNKREALSWLQRAYGEHSANLTNLKANPVYDGLRGETRFASLMQSIGFGVSTLEPVSISRARIP